MSLELKVHENSVVKVKKPKNSVWLDPDTLPWLPWTMPGTWFKLISVNQNTGGFTLILKVDPGTEAPIHGHIGLIESIMLEGEFSYDDDQGRKGHVLIEPPGAIHQPVTKEGFVLYGTTHGPIVGYNEDGSIAGIVDAQLMYEMARAGNAHHHIKWAEY